MGRQTKYTKLSFEEKGHVKQLKTLNTLNMRKGKLRTIQIMVRNLKDDYIRPEVFEGLCYSTPYCSCC